MASAKTYVFRALLTPKLYRDFEIASTDKLADLAAAIVRVFGFDFDHAYGFYSALKGNVLRSPVKYELFADMREDMGESDAGSVKRTRIADAFRSVGAKMSFLFDFGDSWQFRIEVIGQGEKQPGVKYPRLLNSVGKSPEQYPDSDPDDD